MELTAIEQLRQRTREQHAALEEAMYVKEIMAGTLTEEQHDTLLKVNAHFLEAVERNAARFPQLRPFIVPRAALAVNDLAATGARALPPAGELDAWDADRVTGALYVGLGSLLGSTVIASKLRGLAWAEGRTLSFYAQDKEALAVWKRFLAHLGTITDGAAIARMCDGAAATFELAERTVHGVRKAA